MECRKVYKRDYLEEQAFMEGELCIRSFEVGDQEQARWLILEGLGEHFGSIDETLNPDLDDILYTYIIPGHVFLIACMGREMVGTGALILHGEGISEMVRISTRKDYRRRGIGRVVNGAKPAKSLR